jgi:hypothetical protein
MKIEEETFMLANYQHINKLLIKIKDRLEISEEIKQSSKFYCLKFRLEIYKNTDETEKTDEDMSDRYRDGLSFNHAIKYDEQYAKWEIIKPNNAKWEIIIPNLENIKENHMHQYDNYDEDKFSFDSFIHQRESYIEIDLQIYNLFNIPCYNKYYFAYDTYGENNLKIKEIEPSFICVGKNGELSYFKLSQHKDVLLENRDLKNEVDDLKLKIKDLKVKTLKLKSEIEVLEEEKLCEILTNKILRVFY